MAELSIPDDVLHVVMLLLKHPNGLKAKTIQQKLGYNHSRNMKAIGAALDRNFIKSDNPEIGFFRRTWTITETCWKRVSS